VDDLTVLSGQLNVHPNPSHGVVRLDWAGFGQGAVRCEVTDMSGKLIFSHQANGAAALGAIDLSALPRGVHILKLIGAESTATARIVLR
jgi:hypothetical protein